MAERTIVGVDFSGAGTDTDVGKTWVTKGHYDGQELSIEFCAPQSRVGLEKFLVELPSQSVVAMDFPFAVPLEVALWWQPTAKGMPDLWEKAVRTDLDSFKEQVAAFPNGLAYQLLRVGDLNYRNPLPCLHPGRPIMINMTFRGMQMLHRLWWTRRFDVPPLPTKRPGAQLTTLLEVMPGVALCVFGLPFRKYKDGQGEKEQVARRDTRISILKELDSKSGIPIDNLKKIREQCIENVGGDALDSLVAATVAARWVKNESDFRVPSNEPVFEIKRNPKNKRRASTLAKGMEEITVAQLEGWIYAPKPVQK